MKALISPTELRTDYLGNIGCRVAQVEPLAFEVALPLYWMDCPDDCVADQWYLIEGELRPIPQPPIPESSE